MIFLGVRLVGRYPMPKTMLRVPALVVTEAPVRMPLLMRVSILSGVH